MKKYLECKHHLRCVRRKLRMTNVGISKASYIILKPLKFFFKQGIAFK